MSHQVETNPHVNLSMGCEWDNQLDGESWKLDGFILWDGYLRLAPRRNHGETRQLMNPPRLARSSNPGRGIDPDLGI